MEKYFKTSELIETLEQYIEDETDDLFENERYDEYDQIVGMRKMMRRIKWLLGESNEHYQ